MLGLGRDIEVGVQRQDFLGKTYLVNDTLTGTVAAGEKLQVLQPIVSFQTIDVVNCFLGKKLSTQVLLHDVAVLQNFVRGGAVCGWDAQHRVAASNAPGDCRESVPLPVQFTDPFIFTLLATKFLLAIDRAAFVSAGAVELFVAVLARGFVAFVSVFATAYSRARDRAVDRVFAKFLSIGVQVSRFVIEGFTAFSANKRDRRYHRSGSPVVLFMSRHAGLAAKLLRGEFLRHFKRLSTVETCFNQAHGTPPLVMSMATVD